jgi:hypothetical protein
MEKSDEPAIRRRWARAHDLAGLIVSWGLWATLTVGLFLYIRHYSRNIPFIDEFAIVSVMTGSEPVSLRWAWAQYNEHRIVIPRLIMVGLLRFVSTDFRVVRYANAVLLSVMAATMLLVARRVRGSARLTDAVLPLAILSLGQGESVLEGFVLSLILTSVIAIALIAATTRARGGDDRVITLGFGPSLVLLPLCGASGVAMLPPLMLWLVGYIAWGWWSGRRPGTWVRATGLAWLVAGLAVVALYPVGYSRARYQALAPSASVLASSVVEYLGLTVHPYPEMAGYHRLAGPISVILVMATLLLLTITILRSQAERSRALGLVAIILSMLGVAAAVGQFRGGFGPGACCLSRYVSLATPLLGVLYISWAAYGNPTARATVQVGLLALVCLTYPDGMRWARDYGERVHSAERRVERALRDHLPIPILLDRACPAIFPCGRELAYSCFKMLKAARVGAFAEMEDERVGTAPRARDVIIR